MGHSRVRTAVEERKHLRKRYARDAVMRRFPIVAGAGLFFWASCQVYEPSLLTGSSGAVGTAGKASIGSGGTTPAGGAPAQAGSTGSAGTGTGGTAGIPGMDAAGSGADASAGEGNGAGGSGTVMTSGGTSGSSAGTGVLGGGTGGGTGGTSAGLGGSAAGTGGSSGSLGDAGAPDCMTLGDCCPNDAQKTQPGQCGCGKPDTDTDADGTADCNDLCPMDTTRTAPGACGCSVMGADADCTALKNSLVHRYSFGGTGSAVTDSKGSADGKVMGTGATLSGDGSLTLTGGVAPANDTKKQYVELPAGCLTGLTSATFEAWFSWSTSCGSGCTNVLAWQRLFDFGQTATTTSGSYIFLTTQSNTSVVRAAGSPKGLNAESTGGFQLNGPDSTLVAGAHHFALAVDGAGAQAILYFDGKQAGKAASAMALSSIATTDCWLGRSHFADDPYLNGTFDEFRIYDSALSASAIGVSYAAGANPSFLQ